MGQIWTSGANLDSGISLKYIVDLTFLSICNFLHIFFRQIYVSYDISRGYLKNVGANMDGHIEFPFLLWNIFPKKEKNIIKIKYISLLSLLITNICIIINHFLFILTVRYLPRLSRFAPVQICPLALYCTHVHIRLSVLMWVKEFPYDAIYHHIYFVSQIINILIH